MDFRNIVKYCKCCGKRLILNNQRDVSRKNYCSTSCRSSASISTRFKQLPTKICQVCGKEFKPTNNTQINCSTTCTTSRQVERSYKYLNDNPRAYIQHLLCKKERQHLLVEDLINLYERQGGKCAVSGVELTFIKQVNSPKVHTNLSIDRIDSSRGYEIENIQLVCAIVNIMKSTLTTEELLWWCNKMVKNNATQQ